MHKALSFLSPSIPRREFLRGLAAFSAGVPLLSLASGDTTSNTDYSALIEKIRQTFPAELSKRDIVGSSIALIDGAKIVWSEGFGYTDRSKAVKVTPDTLFNAGSISKSLTTLGVLNAVQKGRIALDDPVKRHLP